MKSNRIVLLDVGGTFVKSALGIAGKGAVEGTFMSTPISSNGSAEEITNAFRTAVSGQVMRAVEEGYSVEAVCAALPGPFDYKKGIFLMKHKFAAVYGVSFREILGDVIEPDTRLAFVHDVNGALLGALSVDPSLREGNVAMVTLGTGLGFTYSIDGKVQESETGSPAKGLWNAPYMEGILEEYVSRRGILRLYAQQGGKEKMSKRSPSAPEMARRQLSRPSLWLEAIWLRVQLSLSQNSASDISSSEVRSPGHLTLWRKASLKAFRKV